MSARNPNDFTVAELKELLKQYGLNSSGVKTELIARLDSFDPSGRWTVVSHESEKRQESSASGVNITEDEGAVGGASQPSDTLRSAGNPNSAMDEEVMRSRRELDFLRRENALMERELAMARRELALAQNRRRSNDADDETRETQRAHARIDVKTVAELLSYFDGESDEYPGWSKQIRVLQATYRLNDDEVKILVGMRLRGKAREWMHSRPEFLEMKVDDLLAKFETMFYHRPSKIVVRKTFQDRVWKRGESFADYFHDKIIKANRVPIDDQYELVDQIVEGIPDRTLRNQAKMHCFDEPESLLRAFEKLTLPSMSLGDNARGRPIGIAATTSGSNKQRTDLDGRAQKKEAGKCFNCGDIGHLSKYCPSKARGLKCYGCGEYGHIATACPKREVEETVKNTNFVTQSCMKKACKSVRVNDFDVMALIDTGSDLTLMKAECYIKIGAPRLQGSEITFRGIGSDSNKTLGKFTADVSIDGNSYSIEVFVVSDVLMKHDMLIGADFLNTVEVTISKGTVFIKEIRERSIVDSNVPEICRIECDENPNDVDLSHIKDSTIKQEIQGLVDNYVPAKTREVDIKMSIVLKDDQPVYQRARRLAPPEKEIVNKQINEWIQDGIVQPSLSEYTSPIVLVKKKDGSMRLCVDYRKLNQKIVRDRYPLPLVEDLLDALQDAKVFSTLDLRNGFFHVPLSEDSRKFTSFIVPDGQFEFLRVPFGLCNSPAVFAKFIRAVFNELINRKIVWAYMDDLIVPADNVESAIKNLKTVLSVARDYGLDINWKKCSLLQTKVEFLGHIVENGSIRPSENKTCAVAKFPKPTTAKQVQSFLGLTGYFRKFIEGYSLIARPLSDLLRANVKFEFGEKETRAFEALKVALCEKPVLKLYRANAQTELHTDASMFGFGAVLLQRSDDDGQMHPVYFASGKTTPAEAKYTSYELEVLAIVKSLKKFRIYLLGVKFKIVTDCKAFSLTMSKRDLCVRVARWALLLEEFNYTIEHRSGKRMTHVDALSRNPLPTCLLLNKDEDSMTAKIKKAQQDDEKVRRIFQLADQGKIDEYITRGGLLFKMIDGDIRLVVPKCLQTQLIRRVHENGHFSVAKTEALLKRDYWFQGLRPKIEKTLKNCVDCILAERKTGKQDGFLRPIEKGEVPLDTYHVDHLGPLPSTRKSYRHIFVVVDAFTKFVWLYATKTTNTTEVLRHLMRQAVTFGNPRRIVSDRGTAFTSGDFKEYCDKERIEHSLIATGVPRGNGQVERVNRTLIPLLTKLSAPKPEEWYRHLDSVQRYLNATPHRSINTTPFQLFFGTRMRTKDDPQIRELLEQEWAAMFQEDRDDARIKAKESIVKVQEENRKGFNKKRKEAHVYRDNDLVAIKRTRLGPGLKLAGKYLGPYRVVKALRNDRYVVEKVGDHEGPRETSSVADSMKPWTGVDSDTSSEDSDSEV